MPENFTREQNAQLFQMREPLEMLRQQIWRLQHEPVIDRGVRESVYKQLQEVERRLGAAIVALSGTEPTYVTIEDAPLPGFSCPTIGGIPIVATSPESTEPAVAQPRR